MVMSGLSYLVVVQKCLRLRGIVFWDKKNTYFWHNNEIYHNRMLSYKIYQPTEQKIYITFYESHFSIWKDLFTRSLCKNVEIKRDIIHVRYCGKIMSQSRRVKTAPAQLCASGEQKLVQTCILDLKGYGLSISVHTWVNHLSSLCLSFPLPITPSPGWTRGVI